MKEIEYSDLSSKHILPISVLVIAIAAISLQSIPFDSSNHSSPPEILSQDCSNWKNLNTSSDSFILQNNVWGTERAQQCVSTYNDGSIGWSWERNYTGSSDPNYPEAIYGNKPWGNSTETDLLPTQIGETDSIEATKIEMETQVNGSGKWNTALELWIASEKPEDDVSRHITDEIIILLESNSMNSANLENKNVVNGRCSNYSYYTYGSNSQIEHRYHQFRAESSEVPSRINLKPFLNYIARENSEISPDFWITGLELGNEYWDSTSGKTHIRRLEYNVNSNSESLTNQQPSIIDRLNIGGSAC